MILTNDKIDPGGETFCGISRRYWPRWEGWKLVDQGDSSVHDLEVVLSGMVKKFYLENFWLPAGCDEINPISEDVANEVFDTSVNMSVNAGVSFLQEALNLLNNNGHIYQDLIVDGQAGPKTIYTLGRYLASRPPKREVAERRLLKVMNCLQGSHYIELMKRYPDREKYRGWFDRI